MTISTPTSSKNLDAININTKNKSYAPKNFLEQQKHIKEDYYFKYKSKNYLFLKYSISMLKKALRVAKILLSLVSLSYSTSSGTILLNKFSQS